MDSLQLANFQN